MARIAGQLEALYREPAPDPMATTARGLLQLGRTAAVVKRHGREALEDLLRVPPMPVADWLNEWFENETLKGLLAANAVAHLKQGPRSGGTAFTLIHHHVGSPPGVFPSAAPAVAVPAPAGSPSRAGVTVARIEVIQGSVTGVTLEGGERIACDAVLSGLDPRLTLLDLVDPQWLDPEVSREIGAIRSRGVAAEITFVLDRAADFGTLTMAPSLDGIERAYDSVKHGDLSGPPVIEARGFGDQAGHRVIARFQYVPPGFSDREEIARRTLAALSPHSAALRESVTETRVLTPRDLESSRGWPQGQPSQAELALDQWLWMRPSPSLANYATPVQGLYLCGPAMHPGIPGWCGALAATAALKARRRNS